MAQLSLTPFELSNLFSRVLCCSARLTYSKISKFWFMPLRLLLHIIYRSLLLRCLRIDLVPRSILPLLRVRWSFPPQSSHALSNGLRSNRLSTTVLSKFYGGCLVLYLQSWIGDPGLYAVFENGFLKG